jgi:hypothetical protein
MKNLSHGLVCQIERAEVRASAPVVRGRHSRHPGQMLFHEDQPAGLIGLLIVRLAVAF